MLPLVLLAIVACTTLIAPAEGTGYGPYSREEHYKCPGPNEVFDICPNPCPPQECGANKALILCAPPPKPGSKECKPACRCIDGFLRNKAGVCIPEDHCPYDCPANQTYDPCFSICPPRYCGIDITLVLCLPPTDCVPECRCSDGFLKNGDGDCVLEIDCPSCPGRNEIYDVCPAICPPHRCGIDDDLFDCGPQPFPGDPDCEPGCRCADGYVRGPNDICITREECHKDTQHAAEVSLTNSKIEKAECLTIECPKNETLDPCLSTCPPRFCGINIAAVSCLVQTECEPGCRCCDGFLRNGEGNCVLEKDCPTCPGENEIYDVCPAPCPPRRCDVDESTIRCAAPPTPGSPECEPGCRCADGFVRNNDGVCITRDQCPKCPRPHEVFDPCPPSCPPQTCESIDREYDCPRQIASKEDGSYCEGACRCEPGYFRNILEECISKEDCQKCSGPHEYFSCNGACDNVCATLHEQNKTNCPIYTFVCVPMCYCEDGYARDDNNTCIPIDQCKQPPNETVPICGCNEVLSNCSNGGCGPWTCSDLGYPTGCVKMDPDWCKVGCVCKDGFVRNENETCISAKECPSCGGDPNAELGCGDNCGRLCTNYDQGPTTCETECKPNACECKKDFVFDEDKGICVLPKDCSPVCKENEVYDQCANGGCKKRNCSELGQPDICKNVIKCIGGCVCADGFLRDSNGVCIPVRQCPVPTCGKNERFVYCPDTLCEPLTCSQLGYPVACPILGENGTCPGSPACICDSNFVRNNRGKCIPKKRCPSCGGDPNAESGCGNNCNRLCSNYNKEPVPCPKICKVNGCDCKKNFVLDTNINKCVRPKYCTPTCGPDEVFSECINGGCEAKNCSQLGKPVPCIKISADACIKGCLCIKGYLRNNKGVCVPEDQCEPQCLQPHEVYDPCPPTCPPQTCESISEQCSCPAVKLDSDNCKGACRCEDGFFRNKIGECISKKDCLRCTGSHEYFSCGGACDNVCATLHEQSQDNCPIVNRQCNRMCYCEKGYARDANNTCIPIDECPPPNCGENEKFVDCPDSLCSSKHCSQLGFPISCPALSGDTNSTCPGPPGCVCIDNFVRDDCGKCIPIDQCPSCGGDPNAVSGCGINCGRLCSNYMKKGVVCPLLCKLNSCDCRPRFVLDTNIQKCVRPKDCSPICKDNEVYDSCANGGCQKRNCSQIEEPTLCLDPIECIGGCVCKEGFLRTEQGDCVPQKECPFLDTCPPICPPQTCDSIGKVYHCPMLPPSSKQSYQPACRCEPGCYRNSVGECISEEDCLKCTGPNEHFACGVACDNVCATLQIQNQTNCPIINKRCNLKCYCNEGYARDYNNICIPIKQCGVSCNGDSNAVPGSGSNCGRHCSDLNNEGPGICSLDGCDCKETYVYDDNCKKCVQPTDCTPVCRKNEVYSACANGGCGRRKCSELVNPIICRDVIDCIGDCICVDGFLRNEDGVCVPECECQPTCNGAHEIFKCCPSTCPPQTCESLDRVYICPIETGQQPPCEPACVCEDGFYRNKIGECTSEKDCLQCMGPHEYFSCGGACDNVCATLHEQSQDNCPIVNIQCNRMCYCEKGYARNASNICIPISECPEPICRENEVYDTCANGGCGRRKCSELDGPILCIDPIECIGDCVCAEGFLRNEDGVCVPESECKLVCTRPHEVFNSCPSSCYPGTCESLDFVILCPIEWGQEEPCRPSCVCESGYFFNSIGECVTQEECVQCNGPHEYFSCGGACDNVCATLNEQSQDNCPIINVMCNRMCYCERGYARNASNICIPIDKCPPPRCGPNERFEENPSQVCDPLYCWELEHPKDCPPVVDPNCEDPPACICKYGFVRDGQGKCIPETDCPPTDNPSPPINLTEVRARIDKRSINIATKLIKYMLTKNPGESGSASGTSLMVPLAQLALFSININLEELLNFLNLNSKDEIKAVFPELTSDFQNQENIEFELATKFFSNINTPLSNKFKNDSKKYFNASGEDVDFSQNKQAADIINDWASDNTHGKITNVVSADMFSSATRLVLCNAVYFLGTWRNRFTLDNTQPRDFYKSNGETVSLPTMFQKNKFNYFENDKIQGLEMFYTNDAYSFFVVLPKDRNNNLMDTVDSFIDNDEMTNILNNMNSVDVEVYIPTFELKLQIDIRDFLITNGFTAMFDPANDGFKGILQNDEPLVITDAIQNDYFKFAENGTEAAAVTIIVAGVTSAIYPPQEVYRFEANHPFIFFILYKSQQSVYKIPLFGGPYFGAP